MEMAASTGYLLNSKGVLWLAPECLIFSKEPLININSALDRMTHFLPRLSKSRTQSAILAGFALIIILLAMVWVRTFYGSMKTYQKGEIHFKANQYINAITFYDRSIHWYTPFNPYVHKSARHLWEISMDAQARGDIRLALIAVKTIKRGFVAARSFYTPGRDWIEKCDIRMSELLKFEQGKKNHLKREGKVEVLLLDNPQVKGPDILWSIILLIGLLGWIGSAIGFIISRFRTSNPSGLLSFSNFKWVLFWAVFFAIWIVGMMKA